MLSHLLSLLGFFDSRGGTFIQSTDLTFSTDHKEKESKLQGMCVFLVVNHVSGIASFLWGPKGKQTEFGDAMRLEVARNSLLNYDSLQWHVYREEWWSLRLVIHIIFGSIISILGIVHLEIKLALLAGLHLDANY
jgi:hypothetical protein